MKKGFTLLEMLIVFGIIAVLTVGTIAGYAHVLRAGENARAHELVVHAATALTALFENDGVWPKKIRDLGPSGGLLNQDIAYCLKDHFSLTVDSTKEQTSGNDRFGIVTPWAMAVVKRNRSCGDSATVTGTSTIKNHILHFAVDLNGDGVIKNVNLNNGEGGGSQSGKSFDVRATAIVWCCNKEGKIEAYETGVKKDGIYSWSYGQTVKVE